MGRIFPQGFRKFWSEWKIPVMVLLSLLLQTILIAIGSRRKYSTKNRYRFVTWMAYLLAEWVALVSLSLISNFRDNDPLNPSYIMRAFWAPFLLLHLGGPDNITAYSLEDNEMWQRSFVLLIGQFIVAGYIIFNVWSGNELNILSIPVLLAGTVKFAERICALTRASSERFRKSLFSPPDPGPNYARYMDEYSSKKAEGFQVSSKRIIEAPTVGYHLHAVPANDLIPDAASLQRAHSFLKSVKCLFADLILSIHDIVNSQSFFQNQNCEEVFRVIEIELSFMYDVLYTKAVLIYSKVGGFCRLFTFCCTVSVLVLFSVVKKQNYSGKDVAISYVLLGGAVAHEICAVGLLLCSDRAMLWLSRHKAGVIYLIYQAICYIAPAKSKRWSNKIAQHNLIVFCLKESSAKHHCDCLQKVIRIYDQFMQGYFYKRLSIPADLKELIFQQLLKKSRNAENLSACKELCSHRGDWVLNNENCYGRLGWSIQGEFDESILLWHVATDLLYFTDLDENSNDLPEHRPNSKEMSKMLSDYMLYIIAIRPFMLPNGIGQIRYQDTCAEATEFFKERKSTAGVKKAACRALLKVNIEIPPSEVKGDRSKSVLFDACKLAKFLLSLEKERSWDKEKKWVLISHVWVEMLSYAACQCQRNQHEQQLWQGGELLTHVWLLMAHLGMTKQFQISVGHERTTLIVQ